MTYYTTGNIVRDAFIDKAIKSARASDLPLTVTSLSVGFGLPDDFGLDEKELLGFLGMMDGTNGEAETAAPQDALDMLSAPMPRDGGDTVDATIAAMAPQDAPPEAAFAPATRDEAMTDIVAMRNVLAEARALVQIKTAQRKSARGRLADEIRRFQIGAGAAISTEELLRQNARDQQALRIARANGELAPAPQNQPGPSAIDRAAFYSRGGSANTGHGPKWRRGAAGIESRGSLNHDPRRGPVAKLPSDR
jgi:hypothetical protein